MKKIISIIPFLVVALFHAQSLTTTENYIYSRTYLEPVTSEQPGAAQIQGVQYFDGLGRTTQSIAIKASPNGKDVAVLVMYDQSGRKTKDFMPQPVDSQNGAYIPGIGESSINAYYGVPNAYSEIQYEQSPLSRAVKAAAPGTEWQMNGTHTQKLEYLSNNTGEVKRYKAVTSWNASAQINDVSIITAPNDAYTTNGYYNANTLYKTVTRDENNNETQVFTNSGKQTLLSRKINKKANGTTENVDTYYVYDEFGNLSLVIPPKASVSALTPALQDQLCYQYKYDKYHRVVEKKLPGRGWEYLVYDQQGRVVLSQDANLRTTGNNFTKRGWLFTKYDKFGRTVYTGFFASTAERAAMQAALNNMSANANNNEAPSTTPFTLNGMDIYYTKTAFPTESMTILSVDYYDEYPVGSPAQPVQIQNQATLGSVPTTSVSNGLSSVRSTKTLPTASYTKNVENDSWSSAFIWYDTLGRIIGTYGKNHLGGFTQTEAELDFSGTPQKTITYHARKANEPGVTIKERFIYDAQKRLKQHYHQVNTKPEELLTENTYNELSQLINKKVGNNLQSIDYTYNVRGWLTDINKNQMGLADLGGKLFAYRIKYHQKEGIDNPDPVQFSGKNVTPRYDGSIAEIDWRAVETVGVNPSLTPKRYGYSYDSMNRIQAGYYQNPNNPYSKENTESLDYDLNGNINSLYRTSVIASGSNTATVIDNLSYTYSGNQAIKITDDSQNFAGYEGGGGPITYDVNGNMLTMLDKGIQSVKYNFLDLPAEMLMTKNSNELVAVKTLYRADGTKLRKESSTSITGVVGSTTTKKTTDYLDGFQYLTTENVDTGGGTGIEMFSLSGRAMEPEAFSIDETRRVAPKTPDLQFFATAEGFYDYAKDQYIYQYIDQLGNVRVSYGRNSTGALEITDSNDYYPFGMNHLKTGNSYFAQGSYKSNKYNGKELQETGMYSYGWREYMPDIARWNGIDQLAESYYSHSPYAYVLNNPVNFFDPDGRLTMEAVTAAMWNATPDGTNSYWFNDNGSFTSYDGGPKGSGGGSLAYSSSVGYGGSFTMGDGTYALPPIVFAGDKSGWADQFRSHMEKYGNTTLIDSYFDGFLGGAQSSWNYIKGQFYGESYWDGLANTFTLGAYGTVKTINSLIDVTRNVPNYTANDYSYAAGYLTEKAAEAIILKEASQINPFAFRGGYGFKIGRVELLYSNPSVGGGTIFSYVSSTNKKFRLDYHGLPSLNRGKTLHFHTNYWGYTNSPHRSVNPFRWGQPIK
ncbi:RHS repeat-associated core domain-containing protein [Chryseobacterium sp. WG23]|uniref:RHS repeat-associated core domain-containing protein n=1 Tax=Chryseobacterium sp. WG23 TaxID=2926910 RepID=UPI00211EB9E3|nr:RHS repeat-associated core domain-containing protein [Chryseobacterium sp. WG23]MCQ9634071.1 RHS repeat-associated core domain-containing protein [Chryseobacterium sp. WG23]